MVESGLYRHFKGNLYRVIMTATDTETEREIVIYIPLYGNGRVCARTADNFLQHIEREGYSGQRFVKLREEEAMA